MPFPIDWFQQQTTPFYYYDFRILQKTLEAAKKAVAENNNYHLHYAVKANSNPQILKKISQAGLGADCVSGGEIKAALSCRVFQLLSIVFRRSWKSRLGN